MHIHLSVPKESGKFLHGQNIPVAPSMGLFAIYIVHAGGASSLPPQL